MGFLVEFWKSFGVGDLIGRKVSYPLFLFDFPLEVFLPKVFDVLNARGSLAFLYADFDLKPTRVPVRSIYRFDKLRVMVHRIQTTHSDCQE